MSERVNPMQSNRADTDTTRSVGGATWISGNTFEGPTAVQGSGIQHNTFLDTRMVAAVLAVLIGLAAAGLGYLAAAARWATPTAAAAGASGGLLVGALVWLGWSRKRARQLIATRRRQRDQLLEPLAVVEPMEQELMTARADPLGLLAPQRALIALQGMSYQRIQLQDWCTDPASDAVWLLSGPSGVGKTRMAVELARRLPPEWMVGACAVDRAGEIWAFVSECPEPTLIVVDNADTAPLVIDGDADLGIRSLVKAAAAQPMGRRRVKVLIIVRDHTSYIRALRRSDPILRQLISPGNSTVLAPIGAVSDRRRWYAEAVRAAAAAFAAPAPEVDQTDTRSVGADGDPMILTLARGILAAHHVLTEHSGDSDPVVALRAASTDQLAEEIVELEQHRWQRSAASGYWQQRLPAGLRADTLAEAMLALILAAPTTTVQATITLRRLPSLTDEHEKQLDHLTAWARALYPTHAATAMSRSTGDPDGMPLVTPAPDFLLAALIAELVRPKHEALLQQLAPTFDDSATGEMVLARLVRAAAIFPSAAKLVSVILRRWPAGIQSAIAALIRVGPAARTVEQELIAIGSGELTGAEAAELLRLVGDIAWPHLQVLLYEVIVDDSRRLYTMNPNPGRCADLASSLDALSIRLDGVGKHHLALDASEEAVKLFRTLATADPAVHAHELARALINFGSQRAKVGQKREALDTTGEAVTLLRTLGAGDLTTHSPDLARALTKLGDQQIGIGEYELAVIPCHEAVAILRTLVVSDPAAYAPDLAGALITLSCQQVGIQEFRRALETTQEAVTILRPLVDTEPTARSPTLAVALSNLGGRLYGAGERLPALDVTREAVAIFRKLFAIEPNIHAVSLAAALMNLGRQLAGLGDDRRALDATREAVTLLRTLVATEPDVHTPGLAGALIQLGSRLERIEESRRSAAIGPLDYRPALDATQEAVALFRVLVATEFPHYAPFLARSLENLADLAHRDKQCKRAMSVRAEAVAWWARLTQLRPHEFRTIYQQERNSLIRLFAEHGRDPQAAAAAECAAIAALPPGPAAGDEGI